MRTTHIVKNAVKTAVKTTASSRLSHMIAVPGHGLLGGADTTAVRPEDLVVDPATGPLLVTVKLS